MRGRGSIPARRVFVGLLTVGSLLGALGARSWLGERPYASSPNELAPSWPARVAGLRWPQGLVGAGQETLLEIPSVLPDPVAIALARPVHPGLDTVNVLLIGLDRHRDYKRGGSTDTLVVAAFDRGTDHMGLVSIPRDLYVSVPGHGQTRINAVYGLAQQRKEQPLAVLERVIDDTFGLPIRHSIAIDLELFESAVDVVGGVELVVDCPIRDNFIDPRVEGGRRWLDLDAGLQHVDGVTASMFVRSRHGRSDFARARRQQAVLMALRRKLSTLDGVLLLPELLARVEGALVTGMTRGELLELARRALAIDPRHLHGVVLGHAETIPYRTEQNWSVLLPDAPAIEQRLATLFSAPGPGTPPAGTECAAKDVALEPRGKGRASGASATPSGRMDR